jgi:hypothetical protein
MPGTGTGPHRAGALGPSGRTPVPGERTGPDERAFGYFSAVELAGPRRRPGPNGRVLVPGTGPACQARDRSEVGTIRPPV